jgi:hypothetical protein
MGLDVTAYLIVGLPSQLIIKREKITIDVIKKDKKGISYTVEEEQDVIIFLGKNYDDDGDNYYEFLEKNCLSEFNEEYVGFKIMETRSHRNSSEPVEIQQEELNKKIDTAMKKMESWGLKARLYLIQDISF